MATKKKEEQYTALAKIMGKTFSGKGDTIFQAIEAIDPGNVAGMVILTIKKGKVEKDRVIPHITARRLFNTVGMSREAALKNISLMFQGI